MAKIDAIDVPKLLLTEGAAPSTPAAGKVYTYAKADGLVYSKDDAGTETLMSSGVAGSVSFHGARIRHSTTQTVTAGATGALAMDTDTYDSDAYHFTSDAALTGTVTKTATSANIVGVGTTFTTELTVNQVISIPGTATEIGVVKTITDNTNLVLWQTMANTAAGQTATRRSAFIAIPAGLGGKYAIAGGLNWVTVTTAKVSWCALGLNANLTGAGGTTLAVQSSTSVTALNNFVNAATEYALAAGEYIALFFNNQESGTVTIASAAAYSPFLGLHLIGT